MTRKTSTHAAAVALCSAMAFAAPAGADESAVPEWVHLLPAGAVRTVDGRGPYAVADMAAVIAASLRDGQKLPIDENHAIDRAAPQGQPAPARGWIVALQSRGDGLWGQVEWTEAGRQLMADKAYIGLSPAILHTADMRVLQVLRASLTNTPNLQGMVSLHSEEHQMDWKAKLIERLGLDGNADDAAIDAALTAKTGAAIALNSQDLLAHPTVVALQTQLAEATGRLTAMEEGNRRQAATAFVDAAIAQGRVSVKPLREDYIALHMTDPATAAKMIGTLPVVSGTTITEAQPADSADRQLDRVDRQVMALFGVSEEEMKAGLAAQGLKQEAL